MATSNGYFRRIHSCDHSFYGTSSTRSGGQSNSHLNLGKSRNALLDNLNYSLSQLNNDKTFPELAKHCSVAAIACAPSQCAAAVTSPEFKRKSPLSAIEQHRLDRHQIDHHHHLPHQSYHHLANLDQSMESIQQPLKFNSYASPLESRLKNKMSLKRSATLAECNWPAIEDLHLGGQHMNGGGVVPLNDPLLLNGHNISHGNLIDVFHDGVHSTHRNGLHNSDIHLKTGRTSQAATKKAFALNRSAAPGKAKPNSSASTGKLNASSLATVITAHNKFVKLKNFARANTTQSFKSLPAPRYVRSNVNQTADYI